MKSAAQLRWNGGSEAGRLRQRAAKKSPQVSISRPKPEGDLPMLDDKPPRWKDPGTQISLERIDAAIERIFNDGPRIRHAQSL